MTEKKKGKIIYSPPEKCFTRVYIEETDYGYRIYREGSDDPFTFIPHSAVKNIEYWDD